MWQEIPVPVIAALHGHALGGGLQIALGADIRVVHPDTQLSVREVHWGLVPDMTGTLSLFAARAPRLAKELTFTARIFDGREASSLGLVTRLSDDPHGDAWPLAAEIAERSPTAVRASSGSSTASPTKVPPSSSPPNVRRSPPSSAYYSGTIPRSAADPAE